MDWGTVVADWVVCGPRMRSRFYVNESSFRLAAETSRLAACAPQSGKLAKALGVTAAAAERSAFWGTICWQPWLRQRSCRRAYLRANHPRTDLNQRLRYIGSNPRI